MTQPLQPLSKEERETDKQDLSGKHWQTAFDVLSSTLKTIEGCPRCPSCPGSAESARSLVLPRLRDILNRYRHALTTIDQMEQERDKWRERAQQWDRMSTQFGDQVEALEQERDELRALLRAAMEGK